MTLHQFNKFSEDEKRKAMHEAVWIADCEKSGCDVYRFPLDGFYIETYCHRDNPDCNLYQSSRSVDRLDLYLQKIEIVW